MKSEPGYQMMTHGQVADDPAERERLARELVDLAWHRSLRDQCKAAGVAFFEKQLEVDGKVTGDVAAFPSDLRVQEFPTTAAVEH